MKLLNLCAILLFFLFIFSCSHSKKNMVKATETMESTEDSMSKKRVEALVNSMTGSFDSSSQAEQDTNFYDISLKMFPIWSEVSDRYLYVEQALSSKPNKPYRQRIYKIEEISTDLFKTTVYKLKDQDSFIGKWADPVFFDKFTLMILEEREGCSVYLKKIGPDKYKGSTKDDLCKSTLYGASYATSVVEIQPGVVYSWDQGFNNKGVQVWGAEKGGYIFRKN